jgi:hypothetical protein
VGIGVIGVGDPSAKRLILRRICDPIGVQEVAAVIVYADDIPFDLGQGSPEVMGGVMLDELADIIGQDLTIMSFPLRPAEVKVMLLGSLDDGRDRDPLSVLRTAPRNSNHPEC